MARILGIDWDEGPDGKAHLLRVVEASIQRGQATILRAMSWPEAFSPDPVNAEQAGQRLRERLKEAGIAPAPVLYAVARNRVVFREVRFPDVPDDEVAALVQFQAAKELAFPPEDAIIDYTLSATGGPQGGKRALVVVLHRELLTAIQKTCQTAGLRLEGVSVRPYAILENWRAQSTKPDDAEVSAVFVVTNGGGELCVARGQELLFCRAIHPSSDNGQDSVAAFLPELRRSLAAHNNQFPQYAVQNLNVGGGQMAAGHGVLAEALKLKVTPFDPLPGVDVPNLPNKGAIAGALGMIQARVAHRQLPIDFLAPKKPLPPVNRKRQVLTATAAGIILLVGIVGSVYGISAWSKNNQLEELRTKNVLLDDQIKALADVDKRLEAINAWDHGEMVILDELYDLAAHFPDQPGIRITKVSWAPVIAPATNGSGTKTTTKAAAKAPLKPIGTITLEASGDSSGLERLRKALDAAGHWKLDQWEAETPGPSQARATLKVFHTEPEDYRAVVATPSSSSNYGYGRGGRP